MKRFFLLSVTLLILLILATGCNKNNIEDSKEVVTEKDNLKSFDEVFKSDGLTESIYYLDNNYDSFSNDARDEFMLALAESISEKSSKYYSLTTLRPVEGPAPLTIENVDWLYKGRYSSELNTLYISGLEDDAKEAAANIKDDDFFTLCKKYYAMDGNIEDIGFDIIVEKEIYDILMERYLNYSDEPNYYFELIKSYTDYFENTQEKFQSNETYPIVLVKDSSNIELLRNEWKTEVLLPVKIEEGPEEIHDEVPEKETLENKFDALSTEERMERVVNDVNRYLWNVDENQEDNFISAMFIGYDDDNLKKYINETYIYEIPSSMNFKKNVIDSAESETVYEYDGDTYAYVYNNIFGKNIILENTVNISLFDPPLLDTILVSYEGIEDNTYKLTGAYDGTGRIEVIVDYSSAGIVIKSIKRYEEQGSIGKFKIEEVEEVPSGDLTLLEISNPAYEGEPEENFTTYLFAIEGKYDAIGVFTTKTFDSGVEAYDLALGGENILLKYKTVFPADFSYDILFIRSAGGNEYKLSLDDVVDREPYLFEE